MTPEGKVKAQVKRILDRHRPHVYYHMPVQNGMGSPCLDFNGCAWGVRFDIETKALGKEPTPRQKITIADLRAAGSTVFVIDGSDYGDLELWLAKRCLVGAVHSGDVREVPGLILEAGGAAGEHDQ